jgi:hypothetical protein
MSSLSIHGLVFDIANSLNLILLRRPRKDSQQKILRFQDNPPVSRVDLPRLGKRVDQNK